MLCGVEGEIPKPNFHPAGLHAQVILDRVQILYVAEVDGAWVGLVSWSAAAIHLEHREEWIGWSYEQRRRHLAMVANNRRLLLLPGVYYTNLASRILGLCLRRLILSRFQDESLPRRRLNAKFH